MDTDEDGAVGVDIEVGVSVGVDTGDVDLRTDLCTDPYICRDKSM